MKKTIIFLMALLVLVGCAKRISSVDDAVKIARDNAGLSQENSELIKSSYEDDEYYVELVDDANVYRYVIEEDGDVKSFVKEARSSVVTNNDAQVQPSDNNDQASVNEQPVNVTQTIDRETALQTALSYFGLSEDQVYEIEIDEDNLHSDRMIYQIDFKTADAEYEADVKADGTLFNDHTERNDDQVVIFTSSYSRQEAIDAALEANGHNYADIDELTIKQVVYFDQSYYEVDYEIDHRDYDMIVDANTLEVRVDN